MARYTGAVCRQCRREGTKLFLKGERCYSDKCAINKKSYAPGEHGRRFGKLSEYGLQLREKQKLKRQYGVLERQFARYFDMADRARGITGENLLQILELRLDNVVFRMGFARSRPEARQLVLHRHIAVDGRPVNIPSYQVSPGQEVSVRDKSRQLSLFKEILDGAADREAAEWFEVDVERATGRVLSVPTREQVDTEVEERLIVELYSK